MSSLAKTDTRDFIGDFKRWAVVGFTNNNLARFQREWFSIIFAGIERAFVPTIWNPVTPRKIFAAYTKKAGGSGRPVATGPAEL